MTLFRKVRIFALVFALLTLVWGFVVLRAPGSAGTDGCCWVLECTIKPPIVCWEGCRPCPKFPQR
jgi:hypothetical protein